MKLILTVLFFASGYIGWHYGSAREILSFDDNAYLTDNQQFIDVLHYSLEISLDTEKSKIKGNAVLTGLTTGDISSLDFNFYDNMKISSLTLNGQKTAYDHDGTSLLIPYNSEVDTFIVEVFYEGKPKKGGLAGFVFGERKGKPVVYNLNEPVYASTWFPCNDKPSDKAMLDIHITNDSGMVSVSNGKLEDITAGNGKTTYHWKTYYPISTYLVCIYSAQYVTFSDTYISQSGIDTMSIDYFVFEDHLENAEKDFEDHIKMMNFFASTFGEYPFINEKYGVAEFLWQLGAMEHQTITGIGSNFVSGRKFFNDIYVHELAHQWWGNAVGPSTWKDIWLNEGFSTYSEALYAEHIAGKKALQSTMLSKFDENPQVRLYDPGGSLFNSTVYNKGAWVLHMLRWETGDSIFFSILREYFQRFKYKTASVKDFQNVCEDLSGKDLDQFFRQWVTEGTDLIKADFKWTTQTDGDSYLAKVEIKQKQQDIINYHFPVELQFLLEDGKTVRKTMMVDEAFETIEIELQYKPLELELDPDNWLLALFDQEKWQ